MIVAGGSYLEICRVPQWRRLFGSGGRAAAAIGRLSPGSELHTYAARHRLRDVERSMAAFGVRARIRPIDDDISFSYFHPLSRAVQRPEVAMRQPPLDVRGEVVLRFGFVEGDAVVDAVRAVHDPQTGGPIDPFRDNGSRAEELAVVLNEGEAHAATGLGLPAAGEELLASHGADVVVVKRGHLGSLVFRRDRLAEAVPAYRSARVFKIGTGDVFSAAFAHQWGERRLDPVEAADVASRSVAWFAEAHALPLDDMAPQEDALPRPSIKDDVPRGVYLAGPFFDLAQRWMIEEARECLLGMGVRVFSPLHEVGMGGVASEVAAADLAGLEDAVAVLALLDGADPGSVFEVGHARARDKPVIVLAERLAERHVAELVAGGCTVVRDFTTAVYATAWATLS